MNKVIPERIKFCRKKQKLNQQELADKIGVSIVTIKRWESINNNRVPSSDMIIKIAKALNTSVAYIVGEIDDYEINDKHNISIIPEYNSDINATYSLSYWGEVADNIRKLALSKNINEISLIYPLLKSGCDMLAQVKDSVRINDINSPHVDIRQNNFGRDATVNFGTTSAGANA